jgi:hypothetical protein
LNEIRNNNKGTPMQIIEYKLRSNIRIKFLDEYGYETNTTYQNFMRGVMKNPYDKTIYGIGYLGDGKHHPHAGNNGIQFDKYTVWQHMIGRCYCEEKRSDHPAYAGCTVCKEWHNFQNFGDWYDDNFYDISDGTRMHIDKDVLQRENKIYSPETCIFLPQRINMIFMDKEKNRDVDLPNAIYRCVNGFQSSYNGKSLGVFKTLEEAITAHDSKKRIHIKQVVNEYKNVLPPYIYDYLLKW